MNYCCGPRYCALCGAWPADMTPGGLRCYMCELRDYANANPVPLPNDRKMLEDLAKLGVAGAKEKLEWVI
jgi:hypothetical protein